MSDFVPVAGYRSSVGSVPGGVVLTIPSRRNYFIAAFLTAWLGGWFMGETSAIQQLLHPAPMHAHAPDGFLVFWLCAWTLGGGFALTTLVWNVGGRERVAVQHDTFSIRREAFGIGFNKRYELRSVKNLRVVERDNGNYGIFGSNRRDPFGWSGGPLAFDYGAKTVRFGAGVDVAEANFLLSKLIAAKPALSMSRS